MTMIVNVPFRKNWTHIVYTPTGILFYNSVTGDYGVGRIDEAGNFIPVKDYLPGFFKKNWTHIVNTRHGILFYDAGTGEGGVGRIDNATGGWIHIKNWPLRKNWTHIVDTPDHSTILFYNAGTGDYGVGFVDNAGNFKPVKDYLPGFFRKNWTHIEAFHLGFLFIDATTGEGGVGRIDNATGGWIHMKNYPAPPPQTGSTLTSEEANELVRYHNKARTEVDVGPVKWSPTVAKFAQEWADEVARTGNVAHRPEEGDWKQKYGENWGSGDNYGVLMAAGDWYKEIQFYTRGTPIPEDFASFKAGHYTQMVWKDTTEIGAGKAVIQEGDSKGKLVIVCNYNPRGNITGKKPY